MTLKYWELNVGWEEIYRMFFAHVYNKLFPPPPLPFCVFPALCLCFVSLLLASRKNGESQFPTINYLQWGSYKILSDVGRTVMNPTFYFETSHIELPGATLPVRPATSPAPYRWSSFIPRAGAAQRKGWPGLISETPRELTLDPPSPLSLILHQHPVACILRTSP